CQICRSAKAQYKCPKCLLKYCSLKCYKDESHTHEQSEVSKKPEGENTVESSYDQSGSAANVAYVDDRQVIPDEPREEQYASLMNDQVIRGMLRSPTLQHHLVSIHEILSDPAQSGEHTAEGRHDVALKKFRELRAGGIEDNIEVEEFVGRVLSILEGRPTRQD
ncbi:hypothetical protein LIPSTDRAFT_50421, partial [Lipomyces starkeyi NRRL Y-11557]